MLISAHQPCDYCHSSDGMAIYQDDNLHKYSHCFVCKKKATIERSIFDIIKTKSQSNISISDSLPKEALAYLLKYRIFQSDIISSGIKYDYVSNRILFPIGPNGAYQGRSLDKDAIKYMTYGDKTYKRFGTGDIVVLCEDWLSSYRVAQQPGVSGVCLFGTSCSSSLLLKIVSSRSKLIIWLDGDKPGQDASKKIFKSLALYYPSLYTVSTSNDPKTYSDNEIQEILYERTSNYESGSKERKL